MLFVRYNSRNDCCFFSQDLGAPTEKIWPGFSDLPGAKKVTWNSHQYNVIRHRFGSYFSEVGSDLMDR